ncbi:hypothetical protein ACEUDH_10175 [Aeromonas dhakensis]|uniref:hypothetical protein n=1 Tax=Aeromonas dhakensis TaxID=196024 RepID=UPI0038D0DE92
MTEDVDKKRTSKYLGKIETKEELLNALDKGLYYKQNRIEEVFYRKFSILRKKVHKVLEEKDISELDYEVYVNSILVDCRALFLENARYEFNSTLQSTYKARDLEQYAKSIDEFFNQEISKGMTLKTVIKDWVDKRVVHVDYLDAEDEEIFIENIHSILDDETINNIFMYILIIASQYEEVREKYGKNAEEQMERTLAYLTSDPE